MLYEYPFSSVARSCPTLCDPMNCSMPGLPVHHQLPESTQTHVHRVGDAIQPSHPLLSPSPALNLSYIFLLFHVLLWFGKAFLFITQHIRNKENIYWTHCSSEGKASACNVGDPGSIPESGKDPLEKEMATHPSILAWKTPWTVVWGAW